MEFFMCTAFVLFDTYGIVGFVEERVDMVKGANVEILKRVDIGGAFVTTVVQGDVGSVRAAVEAGATAAQQIGELVGSHVIPRPAESLVSAFFS